MSILTRAELDGMGCAACQAKEEHEHENNGLFLHGRCHVESPTWSFYEDGILTVTCAECDSVIARIAVAS